MVALLECGRAHRSLYSPNQVAEKVASRIAEGFSDTALIMVSFTPAAVWAASLRGPSHGLSTRAEHYCRHAPGWGPSTPAGLACSPTSLNPKLWWWPSKNRDPWEKPV